jgi:hypothetical protein
MCSWSGSVIGARSTDECPEMPRIFTFATIPPEGNYPYPVVHRILVREVRSPHESAQ